MFASHDEEMIDKASMLERFREEVGCLATNLSAMTHHPEGLFKIGLTNEPAMARPRFD